MIAFRKTCNYFCSVFIHPADKIISNPDIKDAIGSIGKNINKSHRSIIANKARVIDNDRFPTTTLGNDIISASGRTATSGFTLIELLVVVLIIGILAAVALPQYETSVAKSRLVQLKILVKSLKDAEELYYMANGSYTQHFEDLDISLPGNQVSNSKELWSITNKVTCSLGSVPRSLHCIGGHSAWEMWLDQTENALQTLCYAYDDDKAAQKACVSEGGTHKTSIGGENFFYIIEP